MTKNHKERISDELNEISIRRSNSEWIKQNKFVRFRVINSNKVITILGVYRQMKLERKIRESLKDNFREY